MEMLSEEIRKKMGTEMAKTHIEFNLLPMLEKAQENGIIEFRLVMFNKTSFYIHPFGKDGETVNIDWTPPNPFMVDLDLKDCKGSKCELENCPVCKNEMY